MAGHQKWSKLADRVKSRPGAPERLESLRRETLQEGEVYRQTLAQCRKAQQVTQSALAERLGVSQAQVSQWENQSDLYLSTVQKYLTAIGAELELVATFSNGSRVILGLDELADPDSNYSTAPRVAEPGVVHPYSPHGVPGSRRLEDYFQPENVRVALDAYADAASRLNWPIREKLRLYGLARDAFASELGEELRFGAFEQIYDELRSYWGVFRNPGSGYWDAAQTFRMLKNTCAPLGRANGLTLRSVDLLSKEATVLKCLEDLRSIKRTARYPYMTVAKFLHFFNPKLVPIYDGAIVWDKLLWGASGCRGAFRDDYAQFCRRRKFRTGENTERFNWNYMLLASELMNGPETPTVMMIFAEWLRQHAGPDADRRVLDDLETYYATAFEFIAIGGAELELRHRGAGGV